MSMRSVWLILVALGFGWLFPAAAVDLAVQDLKFSADITDSNLREDLHVMRGNVRISQEAMSIEADQATASALQSKSSRWTFERSVHIQTQDADLKSNSASAAFSNGALSTARVQGTPALFEQRRTSDKTVRGRAGVIEYDLATGIVKLTGQVWFSYGGNEITSDTVVYNLREERVIAGEQRRGVNITVRPQRRSSGAANSDAPRPNNDESGE